MITKSQRQIFDVFERLRRENGGVPPGISEVAREVNRSNTTVYEHFRALVEAGLLCELGNGRYGLADRKLLFSDVERIVRRHAPRQADAIITQLRSMTA